MVKDTEIKTSISPFSIREGEVKTFDGKDGYVSINQIIHKINIGHITDIHFKILELVNEFEFITSRQLFQLLQGNKVDIASQDKLNNKLEQLVKMKILTRYYFTSAEGKCIYRIYALEKMGKYLLNSRGIECNWQPTDNTKPVEMIKRRLAGNQVIIAYKEKVSTFEKYMVKPVITAKKIGKKFKANAGIKITKKDKSLDIVFEVVRREENWETKFVEKARLYQDFYESFVTLDSGFEVLPQLVLVCEDDKHMVECFREIVKNKIELPNIKFTTDLRQNNEKLTDSLIEFITDSQTGKYKVNQVELKILN